MDITIRIPDDLADQYRSHGGPVEAAILTQLLRFRHVGPQDRAVVLAHGDRQALEDRLGAGHILGSADLRQKVERLARLRVGEIEIPFTPPQWEELVLRARKLNLPVETEIRRIVAKMSELFFNY